jgi:hypothetical protein
VVSGSNQVPFPLYVDVSSGFLVRLVWIVISAGRGMCYRSSKSVVVPPSVWKRDVLQE